MNVVDLVTVYSAPDPIKAEIIKNGLNAEGIRCFIEGENQAGEAGLMAFEVKVQVPAEQADRAIRFIQEHERRSAQE